MRIAGIIPSSLVNGEGVRYVIFLQGCKHHCEGCHNPETWNLYGGIEKSVGELAKYISRREKVLDGVTLSGGEPFLQQDECVKLLKLIPKKMNVWVYTGYKYEDIKDTELARMADVIVDGKFEKDKLVEGEFYGSSNQRIIKIEKGQNVK